MPESRPLISRMLAEINQAHQTRRHLIQQLQDHYKKNVITFFTSTIHPVAIEDMDNDMIECLLQIADADKGVMLVLHSPGGSALAAERIINTCRTYTGGNFEVIVPRMAKSAATMICMGANRIWMSKTAELGPIDPQVLISTPEGNRLRGAYNIIDSYKELFTEATQTDGNIQPFLQQLDRYDARDIREYQKNVELGADIAIKSLQGGMMKGKREATIRKMIAPFLNPEKTMTHGRPIYMNQAREAGLVIEEISLDSEIWKGLWELYIRTERFVNGSEFAKVCESVEDSFHISVPGR